MSIRTDMDDFENVGVLTDRRQGGDPQHLVLLTEHEFRANSAYN